MSVFLSVWRTLWQLPPLLLLVLGCVCIPLNLRLSSTTKEWNKAPFAERELTCALSLFEGSQFTEVNSENLPASALLPCCCCCWSNLTSGSQKWYRPLLPCSEECVLYSARRHCHCLPRFQELVFLVTIAMAFLTVVVFLVLLPTGEYWDCNRSNDGTAYRWVLGL